MARTQSRTKHDPSIRDRSPSDTAEPMRSPGVGARRERYLIAPRQLLTASDAASDLAARLSALPDVEVIDGLAPHDLAPDGGARSEAPAPPRGIVPLGGHAVIVARMSAERAATLHRELGGQLVIEVDRVLTPASLALAVGQQIHDPGVAVPHGAGFDAGFSVRAEGGAPLADATVQVFGQIWSAVRVTDHDGHSHP